MDYIHKVIGKTSLDKDKIRMALDDSLSERDSHCVKSKKQLTDLGLSKDDALKLLALYKSKEKYHYDLSFDTLTHLFYLSKKNEDASLQRVFDIPFLFIKACWLYEHAPYFMFYNQERQAELEEFIIGFALQYDKFLHGPSLPVDSWTILEDPKRVRAVTFWERLIIDPVLMINNARLSNLEGIELSVDFHPFNYNKLLPEEISAQKRGEIRLACQKSGIKIDIHSPIVGPYYPSPDPKKGAQLFFNPVNCLEVQRETIDLARDIGAGAVVVHMVDYSNLKKLAGLVLHAAGSDVRVAIENYCQTETLQNSHAFIEAIDDVIKMLPEEIIRKNFGITLDVGHFNIEGEDPLIAAERVGHYCLANNIHIRLHSTDNYGKLLFYPPAYSADVHGNVSGKGIDNSTIIKLLRSMGHRLNVVAEQIKPLTAEDILCIHHAQTVLFENSFEEYISKGKMLLSSAGAQSIITEDVIGEKAYQFMAGMEGIGTLREHLVYRKIQDKKYLSVNEVKRISQEFGAMPDEYKRDMIKYIDDLLLPIQSEDGVINKSELDLICQNISGALFGTINSEHLDQIFSEKKIYNKGDVICQQDTVGQEMYLIKEGEVHVSVNGSPMAVLGPGEIFGEISLFYNVRRTATIKAISKRAVLGVLSRRGLDILLKNNQPYSYDLIYRLYSILPERMRNLNDKYKMAIDALNFILNGERKGTEAAAYGKMNHSMPDTDIFPRLTQEEARQVFKGEKSFGANELVFAEGDKADGVFYIMEGRLKAVTFSSDYEEILLGDLSKGEIFGEMSLIDGKPRSASILTITPCKMAYISSADYDNIIEECSELTFRLMSFICLSLFWRILKLDKAYADIKKAFR
jgi:CRP-like cAMP-binding protein/sugar phosphate isomerase/epimerase